MHKIEIKLFVYVMAFFMASNTWASDSRGHFIVLGSGTQSCGTVVKDFKGNDWRKIFNNSAWVSGYLTAINAESFRGKDIAKGTDGEARDLWIFNYCIQHPLEMLENATHSLANELRSRQ